jgi:hypothetical protein
MASTGLARVGGQFRFWRQVVSQVNWSSCVGVFFCSAPAEPFFRPGPHDDGPVRGAAVKTRLGPPEGLVLDGREGIQDRELLKAAAALDNAGH